MYYVHMNVVSTYVHVYTINICMYVCMHVCTYVCMYVCIVCIVCINVEHVNETAQCTDLQTVSDSCAEWPSEVALLSAVAGRGCT